MDSNTLYEMNLHDQEVVRKSGVAGQPSKTDLTITRVAGGWIYTTMGTSVFVPYSEEFKPKRACDKCGGTDIRRGMSVTGSQDFVWICQDSKCRQEANEPLSMD